MKSLFLLLLILIYPFFYSNANSCDPEKLEQSLKKVIYQNKKDLEKAVSDIYNKSHCTEKDRLLPFTEFALLGLAPDLIIPQDVIDAIDSYHGDKMHNGLCESGGMCSHWIFCCFPACYIVKTKYHRFGLRWGAMASLGLAALSNTSSIIAPAALFLLGQPDYASITAIALGIFTLGADANAIWAVYRGHYQDSITQGEKGKLALDQLTRLTFYLESNLPLIIEEFLRGMVHHDDKTRGFTKTLWKNLASHYNVNGIDNTVSSGQDEVGVFEYFLSEITEFIAFINSDHNTDELKKVLNHYSTAVDNIQTDLNSKLSLKPGDRDLEKSLILLMNNYKVRRPPPEIPESLRDSIKKMIESQV